MNNAMICSFDGGICKTLHEPITKRFDIIVIVSELSKVGVDSRLLRPAMVKVHSE